MAGLRLQLDPSGMVAGERQAENALDRLKGKAATTGRELDVLGAKGQRAGVVLAGGATQAASGMQRFSAAARPVSMQLSQVAQQTMATGNAVQALAIQLPDIGLAFGTIGTVVGVLAGIGLPILISALGGVDEKGDSLTETLDTLAGSVGSLKSSIDDANQSWSDMSYQFGENTAKARELFALIVEMRTFDAEQSLAASTAAITESLGGLVSYYQKYQEISLSIYDNEDRRRVQAGQLRDLIADMGDEYGLTLIQARDVTSALDAMANASGPAQVADSARSLYESLMDAKRAGAEIPPEMIDTAREALNAAQQALVLSGYIDDAQSSASGLAGIDMAGNISAAAYQAAILAGNFQAAVTAASQLGGYAPDLNRFSSPSPFMFPTENAPNESARPSRAPNGIGGVDWGAPKVSKGGGGGRSGADTAEQAATAYRSLIGSLDPLTAAANAYADAQETINAALKAGKIDATEAARANELAQERFDSATLAAQKGVNVWSAFQDAGGAALDRLIDGTMSLKDALKDMIKEIVLAITKKRLLASIDGGSASDSVGTLLMKGLTGGFAGLFDAGGVISNGQTGIVGENGPELVRSTAGGAVVTSRGETSRRLGNGGGGNTFHIDARGAQKGVGEEIAAAMRAYAPAIVGQAVGQVRTNLKGWNDQIQSDGALA